MARRTCIFCGEDKPATREHAWPDWIIELMRSSGGEIEAERSGKVIRFTAPVTVKRVCKDCNTGWMSDLEGLIQPIMKPLILGHPSTLSATDQYDLALWVMKTAIVFEFTREDKIRFYPPHERFHVFKSATLPRDALGVWLGCYYGNSSLSAMAGHTSMIGAPVGLRRQGYAFTISVGCFVAQLIMIRNKPANDLVVHNIEYQLTSDGFTVQVWPPVIPSTGWPPRVALDDGVNSLDSFHKRYVTHDTLRRCG